MGGTITGTTTSSAGSELAYGRVYGRSRSAFEENQAEMIVHDFAIRAHREIGGDQAGCSFKLPGPGVHALVHCPVLQAGVSGRPKVALTYRAEPQRMPFAEMD